MKINLRRCGIELISSRDSPLPSFKCEGVGETIEEAEAHARKQWLAWLDGVGWSEKEGSNELVPKNSPKTGWQPVETAPSEQRILVSSKGEIFIAVRIMNQWKMWSGGFPVTPTHWMPLPESPKQ